MIGWRLRRALRAPAAPALVALALLVFDAGFYVSRLEPARARSSATTQDLVQRRAEAATKPAAPAPGANPRMELARFYSMLAPAHGMQDVLDRLHKAATEAGLAVQQAEYRPGSDGGRLLRHEVVLPLRGRYPEIRRFLSQVTREIPGLALDSVSLQRANIGAETAEAQVRMTLFAEAGR